MNCAASWDTALDAAAGRVPVVAGIIVDSTRDAVRRGKAIADLDVAALQVTPVHYLFRPDDDAMQEHFRVMGEEVEHPIIHLQRRAMELSLTGTAVPDHG